METKVIRGFLYGLIKVVWHNVLFCTNIENIFARDIHFDIVETSHIISDRSVPHHQTFETFNISATCFSTDTLRHLIPDYSSDGKSMIKLRQSIDVNIQCLNYNIGSRQVSEGDMKVPCAMVVTDTTVPRRSFKRMSILSCFFFIFNYKWTFLNYGGPAIGFDSFFHSKILPSNRLSDKIHHSQRIHRCVNQTSWSHGHFYEIICPMWTTGNNFPREQL